MLFTRSLLLLCCLVPLLLRAQVVDDRGDTITNVYVLGEVVVRGNADGLDLEGFMHTVMSDTSFQHAFLNTRAYPHVVRGALVVRNKGDKEQGTQTRHDHLVRNGNSAQLLNDSLVETGKLRDRKGELRYLTAELYTDVFFPSGQFPADNRVRSAAFTTQKGEGRVARYKSELKQFMFNPGQSIASVPFIGDKLALYSPDMVQRYDHHITAESVNGVPCWRFSSTARTDQRDNATVIKQMVTWFDQRDLAVMARTYRLQHATVLLDFNIEVAVHNQRLNGTLLPRSISYNGDWDLPLKKRELVRFALEYGDWVVE